MQESVVDLVALANYFEFFRPQLQSVLMRRLRGSSLARTIEAEDVIQETFLKIAKQTHFPVQSENIKAYLFKCVLNTLRGFVRGERRGLHGHVLLQPDLCEEALQRQVSRELSPFDELAVAELAYVRYHEIARLFDLLTDPGREIIRKLYLEGMTVREIAAVFELPPTLVRGQAARAISTLRKNLTSTASADNMPVVWDRMLVHEKNLSEWRRSDYIGDAPRPIAWIARGLSAIRRLARPRKTRRPKHEGHDPVDCTVFAPPTVGCGESLFVQVFAHIPENAIQAEQMAKAFDEESARRGFRSLEVEISRGTRLQFHLEMPDLSVSDAIQAIIWRGHTEAVQFEVRVPDREILELGTVIGGVTAILQGIPIGHIKFKISVVAKGTASTAEPAPMGDEARLYRMAFISYASPDRIEVLKRVQMLAAVGIHYFQDILDLEPGDLWEGKIRRYIDECDLFLLFWSSAAKLSDWVRKEIGYAVQRKRGDPAAPPQIRPVILEGPPIPTPPEELAHIHFNDFLCYLTRN